MRIDELDYHLPPELVAQEPARERAASRMLVVHRDSGRIEHRVFSDIVEYLKAPDLLVVNNTRVVPCRLYCHNAATGGVAEVFVLEERGGGNFRAMTGSKKRLQPGERLLLLDPVAAAGATGTNTSPDLAHAVLVLTLEARRDDGTWDIRAEHGPASQHPRTIPVEAVMREAAKMPLPPYIRRGRFGDSHDPADRERYQTVYARVDGAVAAPTAGLHFTPELLAQLTANGVQRAELTLHVGIGTFRPVKADTLDAHPMHAEDYELPSAACDAIRECRSNGGRVVSVGTTTTRVLESCADVRPPHFPLPGSGSTRLLIQPGHQWRVVDALVTNFHLPRSTLLALVMAFGGVGLIREAYRQAIEHKYRFYSYGDAMLVL